MNIRRLKQKGVKEVAKALFGGFVNRICVGYQKNKAIDMIDKFCDGVLVRLFNGKLLILNSNDKGLSYDLFFAKTKIREPLATKYICKKFKNSANGNFLDVGANIGYYTVLLSNYFKNVFAVEPVDENVFFLKLNLLINDIKNVQIVHGAVSHEKTVFIEKNDKYNLAKVGSSGVSVPGVSLESFGKVTLLKMDIEGYEYEIITKQQDYFQQSCAKYLLVEMHTAFLEPEQTVELLDILRNYYCEALFCCPKTDRCLFPRPKLILNVPVSFLKKNEDFLYDKFACPQLLLKKR